MEGQEMVQAATTTDEAGESGNLDSEIMSEWEKRLEGLK